ncbi:hypothetical protein T484DRAFT_1820163, partial [Baffinella frigidus]
MRWAAFLAPLAQCCASAGFFPPARAAHAPSAFVSQMVWRTNRLGSSHQRPTTVEASEATRPTTMCSARSPLNSLLTKAMAPGGFDTARRQRAHGRAVPGLEMSSRSGDRGERDRGQDGAQRRDIRVFVGADGGQTLAAGAMVAFSDDQAHYLRKVMRLVEGSEVKVFDGASGEWWCRVEFTPG